MKTGLASRVVAVLLQALLFLALAMGAPVADAQNGDGLRAGAFSPARAAPDFTLRGSDGSELKLSRYRGKAVVLLFGFTSCPAVCPTTLSTLARARKQLGPDGDQMQVVYVTVDPERDTVARLHDYLASFDSTFVGATGTAEQLDAVRRDYGIFANKETAGTGYTYSHSSYTYLIDRSGNLRALMPYGQPPDDYVHDLKILLEPSAPQPGARGAGERS